SDPTQAATPTLKAVIATRTLEHTCERNQRPAIVISAPVRKTAAHLIGPAASDASQPEPAVLRRARWVHRWSSIP
ncbi:MAG: hypothetical protein WAM21_16480, partial [Steroidobacteraceae bacterium]